MKRLQAAHARDDERPIEQFRACRQEKALPRRASFRFDALALYRSFSLGTFSHCCGVLHSHTTKLPWKSVSFEGLPVGTILVAAVPWDSEKEPGMRWVLGLLHVLIRGRAYREEWYPHCQTEAVRWFRWILEPGASLVRVTCASDYTVDRGRHDPAIRRARRLS